MPDETERSKRGTDRLVLAPGDRVIIANQLDELRARFEEAKASRESDVKAFYRDQWHPFEKRCEDKLERSTTRSNIAIGMAITVLALSAIRLYLMH